MLLFKPEFTAHLLFFALRIRNFFDVEALENLKVSKASRFNKFALTLTLVVKGV